MISERVEIIKQINEPQDDFDYLPIGTVFKKTNGSGVFEGRRAWIPESIKEGEDIDWDFILSEREVRDYIRRGIMKEL